MEGLVDGVAHHCRGKVVETHHVCYLMALRILRGGEENDLMHLARELEREREQGEREGTISIMLSNW